MSDLVQDFTFIPKVLGGLFSASSLRNLSKHFDCHGQRPIWVSGYVFTVTFNLLMAPCYGHIKDGSSGSFFNRLRLADVRQSIPVSELLMQAPSNQDRPEYVLIPENGPITIMGETVRFQDALV